MGFLTTQKIKDLQDYLRKNSKPDLVEGFDANRCAQACYELSLGSESFLSETNPEIRTLSKGSIFKIPAGQMAFLTTKEKVAIPNDVLAFISIKASKKLKGLVNISGFHVDPGYTGNLVFSVVNSSPSDVHLKESDALFLIWFYKLESDDQKPYTGKGKTITTDLTENIKGAFPSNGVLAEEIKSYKLKYNIILSLLVVCGLPAFLVLWQFAIDNLKDKDHSKYSNKIEALEKQVAELKQYQTTKSAEKPEEVPTAVEPNIEKPKGK